MPATNIFEVQFLPNAVHFLAIDLKLFHEVVASTRQHVVAQENILDFTILVIYIYCVLGTEMAMSLRPGG